jgi:hypothetical protein
MRGTRSELPHRLDSEEIDMYGHQTGLRRETVEGTETIPTGFASTLEAIHYLPRMHSAEHLQGSANSVVHQTLLSRPLRCSPGHLQGFRECALHEALLVPLRHSRVAAPLPDNHTHTVRCSLHYERPQI